MEGFDILGPFLQYGAVLQVVAIVHFIQRRPDGYWLWIIIIGGGLGALAYFIAEVIPDAGLLRGTFQGFPRRKRIRRCGPRSSTIHQSPTTRSSATCIWTTSSSRRRANASTASSRREPTRPIRSTGARWRRSR